ncbi:MAG: hypothetical protein HC897_20005 [Thermoanaerobaculia bacterium]|nr:hypothetical protein [Thermoanaerobaculia bacterium]
MPHQHPTVNPPADSRAESLDGLFRQLERALLEVFAADSTEPDAGRGIFQEARLAVTARRREIEKPGDGLGEGLIGMDRLRRMKYWHDRQQSVCEVVDRVLFQHLDQDEQPLVQPPDRPLDDRPPGAAAAALLAELIDQLPPRCRGLLRLRYGIEAATDPLAVKLSDRKAGIRKTTGRCLTALSRLLLERGLAEKG